jgi:hypothetical protein
MLDTETGATEEHKLMDTSGEAEGFYRKLASPAIVGIETVGNDQWLCSCCRSWVTRYASGTRRRTWDPLGLRSLNPDSERCLSNGQDTFVLDNIFALIDEYICADLSIDPPLFPCSRAADHTFSGSPLQ